ncbi:hypothetical protein Taro_031886 [Colocasia esculenta]|uniref:Superoxide dismutase copper/zinc binding domain-containing protein n=1 Tax=Colocasia esculenta TaxID=4460 RepID=A0A843VT90_COLES|nr:hypothetical protein [Colocasia esculenta]
MGTRNPAPCGFVDSRIGVRELQGQDLAAPTFRVPVLSLPHLIRKTPDLHTSRITCRSDRDSRGHLLRLLRRPREGDPWHCSSVDILAREIADGFLRCSYVGRCSSVDILAREIPGGFLRCSSVGRCSSVDILAREIPRLAVQILLAPGVFPHCAEATATPFPSFLEPVSLSRSRSVRSALSLLQEASKLGYSFLCLTHFNARGPPLAMKETFHELAGGRIMTSQGRRSFTSSLLSSTTSPDLMIYDTDPCHSVNNIPLSGPNSILGRAVVVHADPDDLGRAGLAPRSPAPIENTTTSTVAHGYEDPEGVTDQSNKIYKESK